jgi:hypothetical protein
MTFLFGLFGDEYDSVLSSAFAQHGAKFQVQSAHDSLRAIGNPKMYKPTQQFFFSLPRVRKEDRPRSNYEVFTFPQQHTATPPHGPLAF